MMGDDIKTKYSGACRFFDKTNLVTPLQQAIREAMPQGEGGMPEYCAVRVATLVRLGVADYGLYLKLSDNKYVKFAHGGAALQESDVQKLALKKIDKLHIKSEEVLRLLSGFQGYIGGVGKRAHLTNAEKLAITHEANDLVRSLYSAMGWSKEVQAAAKNSMKMAIEFVSSSPRLIELLMMHAAKRDSYVASHSSTLIYVCCALARSLNWVSEYSITKLSMTAFLHDLPLTEEQEERVIQLNRRAYENKEPSDEVEAYKKHPELAAELAAELEQIPPDVAHIIQQHHERPDGKGFPAGLKYAQIHPLAALFIVAEDLILFLEESDDLLRGMQLFVSQRGNVYRAGHFKDVLNAIASNVRRAPGRVG